MKSASLGQLCIFYEKFVWTGSGKKYLAVYSDFTEHYLRLFGFIYCSIFSTCVYNNGLLSHFNYPRLASYLLCFGVVT